jgi:hypothetical protein
MPIIRAYSFPALSDTPPVVEIEAGDIQHIRLKQLRVTCQSENDFENVVYTALRTNVRYHDPAWEIYTKIQGEKVKHVLFRLNLRSLSIDENTYLMLDLTGDRPEIYPKLLPEPTKSKITPVNRITAMVT